MSQVAPPVLGTVRTVTLEELASGTFRDVPSSPSFHGTIRTGILEGLASGTSWDVPSSLTCSWDYQDWDSRGASFWDLLRCLK